MSEPVTLRVSERAPGVAEITMARPAVFNAFDEQMIGELDAAFTRLCDDPAVRVIVLSGEGKHFSAGADLQWMQRASTASLEWNLQDARRFAGMLGRIEVPWSGSARVLSFASQRWISFAPQRDLGSRISRPRVNLAISASSIPLVTIFCVVR